MRARPPSGYYITCAGRTDGGGAQIHAVFSTLLYARCNRLTYLHTPLESVEHNARNDEHWVEKWERAFSPGYGEVPLSAFDLRATRLVSADTLRFEFPQPAPAEPVVLVASECHWYADSHAGFYSLIQPALFRKYQQCPRQPWIQNDRLKVAIHIRRGDVGERDVERFTPNATVLQRMEQVSRALASIPHEMHVFSEGRRDDFGPIGDRAVLHLNGDVFECLHNLIAADIFLMAKSSFSYIAALLARGIVIYTPFWHAPLRQWVVAGGDGSIPRSTFQAALSRKLLLRSVRRPQHHYDALAFTIEHA